MAKAEQKNRSIFFLLTGLSALSNRFLLVLAKRIPLAFRKEFANFYKEGGRLTKLIRLTVGLLIINQKENVSEERIIEALVSNPYP